MILDTTTWSTGVTRELTTDAAAATSLSLSLSLSFSLSLSLSLSVHQTLGRRTDEREWLTTAAAGHGSGVELHPQPVASGPPPAATKTSLNVGNWKWFVVVPGFAA